MTDYTDELNRLFEAEEAFRQAAFQWNQLDDERKKKDLLKVFGYAADNRAYGNDVLRDMLVLSKLLSEEYIAPQSLLLIPDLAIEVALTEQEEVAAWVRNAFCRKQVYKKLERSYIAQQISSVAAKLSGDARLDACHEGWLMLYRLGFKKELLEFMEQFEKELEGEIDEEDRQDILDMPDEEDAT